MGKKSNLDLVLRKLWLGVAGVSVLVILFGIVLSILGPGIYLEPGDDRVQVEVVSGGLGLNKTVSFVLVGVVVALFLVTVVLLIVLYIKRSREKRAIPKFDVFGTKSGLSLK